MQKKSEYNPDKSIREKESGVGLKSRLREQNRCYKWWAWQGLAVSQLVKQSDC